MNGAAAKKLRKLTRKLTSLRPPKCTYLDQIATVFGTAEHIPPLRPTDDLPVRTSSARTSCLAEICQRSVNFLSFSGASQLQRTAYKPVGTQGSNRLGTDLVTSIRRSQLTVSRAGQGARALSKSANHEGRNFANPGPPQGHSAWGEGGTHETRASPKTR